MLLGRLLIFSILTPHGPMARRAQALDLTTEVGTGSILWTDALLEVDGTARKLKVKFSPLATNQTDRPWIRHNFCLRAYDSAGVPISTLSGGARIDHRAAVGRRDPNPENGTRTKLRNLLNAPLPEAVPELG